MRKEYHLSDPSHAAADGESSSSSKPIQTSSNHAANSAGEAARSEPDFASVGGKSPVSASGSDDDEDFHDALGDTDEVCTIL